MPPPRVMPTCPTPTQPTITTCLRFNPYCLFAACHPNGQDLLSPIEDVRKQGSTPSPGPPFGTPAYLCGRGCGPSPVPTGGHGCSARCPASYRGSGLKPHGWGRRTLSSKLTGSGQGHTDRSLCTAPSFQARVRGHTEGLGDQRTDAITSPGTHANQCEEEEEEPDSCFLPGKMK